MSDIRQAIERKQAQHAELITRLEFGDADGFITRQRALKLIGVAWSMGFAVAAQLAVKNNAKREAEERREKPAGVRGLLRRIWGE